ncbi:aminotransferase class III-fold pyridoxal phosphate-dependent enzyme [Lentibacillus sp. CBA3610]|uniref:aminotransferase class III-fold pyridoxal phosphate-dependent enzyme n=1 Tax=Lentibacillus sp. CBA3610 TaxID=2518176 RepID=UPI0015954F60|nr:aminotransferase class III-fold pyridoxal phosphate-dependent enzyme [Lentibacillus sp. CBA3610]QKY71285.1 aminotransferase class III-fold pyridoxal phosphate-dependent enzyme [Lentibacillus sp. CBA3610]
MTNYYDIPVFMDQSKNPQNLINITNARDEYLISKNGKKYLDLRSGLWNVSLGYNNAILNGFQEEISKNLNKGMFYLDSRKFTTDLYQNYAKKLLGFINQSDNFFKTIFYSNSGSETIELALKMASSIFPNKKTVAYANGFHGTYFGGMAVSGIASDVNKKFLNGKENVSFFAPPTTRERFEYLINYIEKEHTHISSFIFEPILGSAGTTIIPEEFTEELLETCKRYGIITIFDEVATGFFRTGERFYFNRFNHKPDIVLLSKNINNGLLPFGAVVINKEVANLLDGSFIDHFSTQNGNILGIISSTVVLDYLIKNENQLLENIRKIDYLINTYFSDYKLSGKGALYSIPIDNIKYSDFIYSKLAQEGILVANYSYRENLTYKSGISLFPHFNINLKKFEKTLEIIVKNINSIY